MHGGVGWSSRSSGDSSLVIGSLCSLHPLALRLVSRHHAARRWFFRIPRVSKKAFSRVAVTMWHFSTVAVVALVTLWRCPDQAEVPPERLATRAVPIQSTAGETSAAAFPAALASLACASTFPARTNISTAIELNLVDAAESFIHAVYCHTSAGRAVELGNNGLPLGSGPRSLYAERPIVPLRAA